MSNLSFKKHKSFKHAYIIPFKFIDGVIEIFEGNRSCMINIKLDYNNTFGLRFKVKEKDDLKTRYYQIIGDNAIERLKSVSDFLFKSLTCARIISEQFEKCIKSIFI